jgi:hypothetical protein
MSLPGFLFRCAGEPKRLFIILPPQAFFQADKALVTNDQVIDQFDVQVLARGD